LEPGKEEIFEMKDFGLWQRASRYDSRPSLPHTQKQFDMLSGKNRWNYI